MEPEPIVGVLALGDYGREECGVGSSEAVIADHVGGIAALATETRLWSFVGAARRLARATDGPCVGVYPTASTVYSVGLLPRVLVLRLVFGRQRLRLHLHELRHLRRMLRWPMNLVLLLLPSRVIVTSASEADAVRATLRGWVGRRCEVVIAPPANPNAPTSEELRTTVGPGSDDRARTVGVFGFYRPDKEVTWLEQVLERVPAHLDRLLVAGRGWDAVAWSPAIRARYEIDVQGHVPRSSLPAALARVAVVVSPLDNPAHDGRNSVRTPLSFGVPTVTLGPRTSDFTLEADHLVLWPPADPATVEFAALDRSTGAAQVAAFEEAVLDRLGAALFA